MRYHQWNPEEKKIVDETFKKFTEMSNTVIEVDDFHKNKTNYAKKNFKSSSSRKYSNERHGTSRDTESRWRKQQEDFSEKNLNTNVRSDNIWPRGQKVEQEGK